MRWGPEMRVLVDQHLCGTTGQCMLTLPRIFRQRASDGIAEVCVAVVPDALHAAVRLAASQCPVAAIRLIERDAVDDADHGNAPPSSSVAGQTATDQPIPGGRDEPV
ncbi:ferredoxin [Xanthomonas translucens]|uniref:ferredoxin n=3 Tax=Xanthomonas campestris pv. translucens TaxID=343 RepID=UPI0021B6E870|nr:ferredoxin [Xanthomonas translucens]MCS3372817.1 ferredoxin [Xanthomonas translucens pv. translucens]MCT8273119.1 ferredoxin [Xanthomonas translucens pv. translucens]WNJ28187.1 ferredoxin [Xanthomonas translucens pv. translucens]